MEFDIRLDIIIILIVGRRRAYQLVGVENIRIILIGIGFGLGVWLRLGFRRRIGINTGWIE